MLHRYGIILALLSILPLPACHQDKGSPPASGPAPRPASGSVQFPGTQAGAEALVSQFLDPQIEPQALTKLLRPGPKDFQAVFVGKAAKAALLGYQQAWDQEKIMIRRQPDQTQVRVWSARAEALKQGSGEAAGFPEGYALVAPHLQDGITWYRFKFLRPGETLGYAWDGLVFVNGHWVFFPKPWRVLK